MTKKVLLKNLIITSFQSSFITILILSLFNLVLAEERQSSNYTIAEDSLNFGGGFQSSDQYELESTAGEIATGEKDSQAYSLRAGYQQMNEVFISMTSVSPVVLLPAIGGLTGGVSNGEMDVVVTTDSTAGYQLSIKSEASPAMRMGADFIEDYVSVNVDDPDFDFQINNNKGLFGYSVFGQDVTDFWKNDGNDCNAGSDNTVRACWFGLTTTDSNIASGGSNQPDGATTTIYFRVGIGDSAVVSGGDYVATTTLTALAL